MEIDPLRRRPRGHRDADELTENKAYLSTPTVTFPENNKPMSTQYIIWNPASSLPPKAVQPDRQTAIRVAGRMAHENPGQTFYVCKLTNSACKPIPPEVTYQDLDR